MTSSKCTNDNNLLNPCISVYFSALHKVILECFRVTCIMLYLLVGRLPVSPEEVFLLLSDFRKWVSVTQLSELICVTLCQGVISGHSIALKHNT